MSIKIPIKIAICIVTERLSMCSYNDVKKIIQNIACDIDLDYPFLYKLIRRYLIINYPWLESEILLKIFTSNLDINTYNKLINEINVYYNENDPTCCLTINKANVIENIGNFKKNDIKTTYL